MRISLLAVGRLRAGPEAVLLRDYMDRFDAAGRALALGPARMVEVEDRRGRGVDAEADLLLAAAPEGPLVALDERGRQLDSPALARLMAAWRDDGARDVAFAIGGADGHGEAVRERAALTLSFGPMVWPHMLARVMLAEQLYRAATILGGGPYHRA
ncbi:23S rRNA (pseudouridine(1915)-N(3))-methyltransferase RlmH [Rubrimonas cliftonensis]|uniref:23S rRNA (pseudouridine(1915)-N(3))-methyltransferase RlmH n=1 Tax=Rubrimonas cliftonensis TaxID=89524 RepID=UPI000A8014B9|nr:23S rRNA (pseudouridine(1915)-N(3))-methyltransferase RlmH [Rubrimonas cliftonensis]